jgi:EAL and modified HD-GYP domain-containing signal transduction protein
MPVMPERSTVESIPKAMAASHAIPLEKRREEEVARELPRFITRQPLLDKEYHVVGYELKINERTPLQVLPGATSVEQVQDENLLVSVIDLEYQQALSRKFTLLNLHAESLDNPLLEGLPRETALIAPRATSPTPALLARCQALVQKGYALALDESLLSPGMAPLARQSRYLRFDVDDNDLMALCDRMIRMEGVKGPRLIAHNVETEEAFAACRKLSFDLYQGYFFTQLRSSAPHGVDTSRMGIMDLLNLVMSHAENAAIEARFKQDAGLSYKLLRYINSPAVGLRYPIRSIGHVLIMLGHDQLYRWLTLLLFSHERADGRSQALLRNALVRARFAETLGESRMTAELRGGLFVTAILSMLDALLNISLDQAIASLNLAQPITDALLHGRGAYAPYLQLAVACENGDQDASARLAAELGLPPEEVNSAHINALIWSEGLDL